MNPRLGFVESLRFAWRQLTSMRTALILLLLLALAAVPGSLVPQRTADPNGVVQYRVNYPDLYPIVDALQGFDVYTSVWFSAVYLLLFVSLIGCVLPRARHHWIALRARPPRTPARLSRFDAYTVRQVDGDVEDALAQAATLLRTGRYRVERYGDSLSAERGYLRETGNLVFHASLVGVLVTMAVGGALTYSGQKLLTEGDPFVNYVGGYDSFNRGRLIADSSLDPYRVILDKFEVTYESENRNALGLPIDYAASVTVEDTDGGTRSTVVRVNEPLTVGDTTMYLLGNGYAPRITVRDPAGKVVLTGPVPFLPQDTQLTSTGVIKVPDGLQEQIGMVGFFYPSPVTLQSGAFTSASPVLNEPLLSLNVYTGDLGLDNGVPVSVYTLNTDTLTQIAGGGTSVPALRLAVGETASLPGGLGTVTLEAVPRFASFDIRSDPTKLWVLAFSTLIVAGVFAGLLVPRRRLWIRVTRTGDGLDIEYAGLARGDDPRLAATVSGIADRHAGRLRKPLAGSGGTRDGGTEEKR